MKGRVGTPTNIVRVPKSKKRHKVRRGSGLFCVVCRGWIRKGQWYEYKTTSTVKHSDASECRAAKPAK